MKTCVAKALLVALLLPGLAAADPWKDESGHGRRGKIEGWGERLGEPPAWARGKGYWDGHFKHAYPPIYRGDVFGHPYWQPHEYRSRRPMYYGPVWRGDRDSYKDWLEDRRERLKERREEEREARKDWREWQRENGWHYRPPVQPLPPWR